MILAGHNGHLYKIEAPPITADPRKGVAGQSAQTKWQGDCQAWLDEDLVDEVRGSQRVQITEVLVEVPANLPTWPQPEDLLTIVRLDPIGRYGRQQVLKVRHVDEGTIIMGRLRFQCRRS